MKKHSRSIMLLAVTLILIIAFGQSVTAEETLSAPEENLHAVITFLGDCTLGAEEQYYNDPRSFIGYAEENGLDYFFSQVQDIISNDDLTVANLESVFSDDGTKGTRGKTYCFRAPVSYAKMLNIASIEAVSFANNHSMDYGESGARDTIAALESIGVDWFGANPNANDQYPEDISKTWIYEKDGVKIGFAASYISAWWIKADRYRQERKIQKTQMDALKEQGCDLIIACLHGGVEYGGIHDTNQDNFANAYFQYGADIIIGTHPHRLQGISVDDRGTICYSLGNFCFGGNMRIHKYAETTCIFQFDFEFDKETHTYLGYTMTLYPAVPGSLVKEEFTDYQPKLVSGKDADAIIYEIQRDTYPRSFKLNPYVEGVGAVQNFVPNPKLKKK